MQKWKGWILNKSDPFAIQYMSNKLPRLASLYCSILAMLSV